MTRSTRCRCPKAATAAEAIVHADCFARHAIDGLREHPDAHPGIRGHLTAARVQLEAALKLAATSKPQHRAA